MKLIPCPFCGGEAHIYSTLPDITNCKNLHCVIFGIHMSYKEWNNRVDGYKAIAERLGNLLKYRPADDLDVTQALADLQAIQENKQ